MGQAIHALIFDLDDTLYRETDFVVSGYRAVSQHASAISGYPFGEIYNAMLDTFAAQGRRHVMETVLERYLHGKSSIGELVKIYRQHQPEIRLFSGYKKLLEELHRRYRIGVITDGLPEVQRRKVHALRLEDAVDEIVYTWDFGAERQKPHPFPFMLMVSRLNVIPSSSILIGDNFGKDCRGALRVGMASILVGGSSDAVCEDRLNGRFHIIDSLLELPEILRKVEESDEVA